MVDVTLIKLSSNSKDNINTDSCSVKLNLHTDLTSKNLNCLDVCAWICIGDILLVFYFEQPQQTSQA